MYEQVHNKSYKLSTRKLQYKICPINKYIPDMSITYNYLEFFATYIII